MDNTLGDFLSEEPLPETEAVIEVTEEAAPSDINSQIRQEMAQIARDEKGRFKAKEETGVAETADAEPVPPTEQTNRLPQAEYAALRDERQKRQQLEERLRQYDQYFAQLQAQPQQPQQRPDMFEDPEGHEAYVVEQAVARALEKLQPTIQHGQTLTRAEVSEMLARQKYEDYDDTVEVFKEAMEANPFLLSQLQRAADPATFAYNAGKQYQAAKAFGSEAPPSREQIEAELREKLVQELGLNRPTAPSTFAADRSVGSRSGPAWSGPTSMGDLLR